MNSPLPRSNNEIARLDALRQYQILDTPPEKVFDDFTFLAAQICRTPIALISLVDGTRQWFKSKVGLTVTETRRDIAFCAHTILQRQPLVVRNALADDRFATNLLVTSEPNIRFYAGAPLITPEGFGIGTLCVIDMVPRELPPEQLEALRVLSDQVMAQFELRRNVMTLSSIIVERQQHTPQFRSQQDFIEVHYQQGINKAEKGDYEGAITDFSKFLHFNPHGVKAYYSRGQARLQLGDYKGAMADFDMYLQLHPNDAEVHCHRGLVRFKLGDYKGAIADYSQAMDLKPESAVTDYGSNLAFSQQGHNQKVIAPTQSLPLDIDFLEANISSSVNANSVLELQQEAIEDNTKSPQHNTHDGKAHISQGVNSFKLKDDKRAIEEYTKSVRLNPNDAKAYLNRADLSLKLEDYTGAVEDYTESLQLNPHNAKAYLNRGIARSKLEDYRGAIEDYTESLQLNPRDAKAYISRGSARCKLKDYNGALDDYKKAREV